MKRYQQDSETYERIWSQPHVSLLMPSVACKHLLGVRTTRETSVPTLPD
jgi:hypothetical protein